MLLKATKLTPIRTFDEGVALEKLFLVNTLAKIGGMRRHGCPLSEMGHSAIYTGPSRPIDRPTSLPYFYTVERDLPKISWQRLQIT